DSRSAHGSSSPSQTSAARMRSDQRSNPLYRDKLSSTSCRSERTERASIDFPFDITEMAFAPPLIAERQHDPCLAAHAGDFATLAHRVGDRLVEEDVLAGRGRRPRGWQ